MPHTGCAGVPAGPRATPRSGGARSRFARPKASPCWPRRKGARLAPRAFSSPPAAAAGGDAGAPSVESPHPSCSRRLHTSLRRPHNHRHHNHNRPLALRRTGRPLPEPHAGRHVRQRHGPHPRPRRPGRPRPLRQRPAARPARPAARRPAGRREARRVRTRAPADPRRTHRGTAELVHRALRGTHDVRREPPPQAGRLQEPHDERPEPRRLRLDRRVLARPGRPARRRPGRRGRQRAGPGVGRFSRRRAGDRREQCFELCVRCRCAQSVRRSPSRRRSRRLRDRRRPSRRERHRHATQVVGRPFQFRVRQPAFRRGRGDPQHRRGARGGPAR